MPHNIPPPHITTQRNTTKNQWYICIYYPKIKLRHRYALGIPLDKDPAPALAQFKTELLPAILQQIEQEITQAGHHLTHPASTPDDPHTKGPRLRDIIDWYINKHLPYIRRKPATITKHDQVLRDFENYCRSHHIGRIAQIHLTTLQDWQAWMNKNRPVIRQTGPRDRAPNTTRTDISIIRTMLTAALDTGKIQDTPIRKWILPPRQKKSRFKALTHQELPAFLTMINTTAPEIRHITHWLALTAWRASDTLDLRIQEINLKQNTIERHQIKIADDLNFPITPPMRHIIQEIRDTDPHRFNDPQAYLFHLPIQTTIPEQVPRKRYQYLHHHMIRACHRAHFRNVTPHDLRKTTATLLANGDPHADPPIPPCPPRILQNILGHKDINTTITYYTEANLAGIHHHLTQFSTCIQPQTPPPPRPKA